MAELEAWAHEIGYAFAVLETGILQPDAIRLYEAAADDQLAHSPLELLKAEVRRTSDQGILHRLRHC